ncbi:hypothetical protein [Ferrimonas balearica]|uniref:hypothetical protein n=1 Tax=Ferrimonas balearica TaxID=44012 RepID=UPI001C99B668|nr:hypothetical protein [Ferrimonas balearica]MBY5992591.1 hypothetical protein [Ferrimonas balearica]
MLRGSGLGITLLCALFGGALALHQLYAMLTHARLDSEGGTFVYGLLFLLYLSATALCVLVGSLLWWRGLVRHRRAGGAVSGWERWGLGISFALSGLWLLFILLRVLGNAL